MSTYNNIMLTDAPAAGVSRSDGNQRYNMYTRQQKVGDGYTPVDPTTDPDFFTNYREATKSLGSIARAWKTKDGSLPTVDAETKSIMDRIKLPTYNEALPDSEAQRYMDMHSITPEFIEQEFNKASNEWEEDNFYYKLRAAQVLKQQPKELREGMLNNFNISAYDAKNELDKLIDSQNKADARAMKNVLGTASGWMNSTAEKIQDALLRASGQRTTEERDGMKITTTTYSGGGNLQDFAERMRAAGGKSRLLTKEEALKEAENKAKTPASSDKKAEESSDKSSDESEVIYYTYKPGDTFGQVLKDLGIGEGNLWGNDGTVKYYSDQLWATQPEVFDSRGNIKVGTTIKLKRRK